jgi:hypothetical protein
MWFANWLSEIGVAMRDLMTAISGLRNVHQIFRLSHRSISLSRPRFLEFHGFLHCSSVLNCTSHFQLTFFNVVKFDYVWSDIRGHFISFHSCSFLFKISFQRHTFEPMRNQITPINCIFSGYTPFNRFAPISPCLSRFSLIFQHFPALPQPFHLFSFVFFCKFSISR